MTITPDVRLEYLEGVASVFLKFKPDKWHKMVSVEENMGLLTEFFEKPDVLVLVLALSPAGTISPCLGFPASLKSKGLYFIKKRPDSISKDNYKDRLVYGDIGPAPVDQLIAVVEEVGASRPPWGRARAQGAGHLFLLLSVSGREPCSSEGVPRPGSGLDMQRLRPAARSVETDTLSIKTSRGCWAPAGWAAPATACPL